MNDKKLHLDKRAHTLAKAGEGDGDDLLNTQQLSDWLGVSTQWCEIGRCRDYGPKWIRVGARRVRYRRSDVLAWLAERTYSRTADYENPKAA